NKTVTLTSNYSGADAGNYNITDQANSTAGVSAKALTVSGISAANKVYDGNRDATINSSAAGFDGMVAGDVLSVTATGLFDTKNVGSNKTVTLTSNYSGVDAGNYNITDQVNSTAGVSAKALTVSGISAANKVYDGNRDATINSSAAGFDGMVAGDVLSVTATGLFDTKHVGSNKTVTLTSNYSGADAGNYNITDQASSTAGVSAKALTVSGISAANKVYDGNRDATINSSAAGFDGMVAGDVLSVTATGLFDTKNVGSNKTVTLIGSYGGADVGNYNITQANTTADVSAKALTVSGISAANKVYDGTSVATINSSVAGFDGMVADDVLSVTATGLFDTKNVGNNKTVTLTSNYSGADAGNYNITDQVNSTAGVSAKALTVSGISAANKVYDGNRDATINSSAAGFDGMVVGDVLSVTATGLFDTKNVGSNKTVILTSNYSGADAGNYNITDQASSTAGVSAKALTVSGISAANKVYDGNRDATINSSAAGFDGMVAGDVLSVTATGLFDTKNVGSNKTVILTSNYSGADVGNYNITDQANTTANVTPEDLAISGISAANNAIISLTVTNNNSGSKNNLSVGNPSSVSQGLNQSVVPVTFDSGTSNTGNGALLSFANSLMSVELAVSGDMAILMTGDHSQQIGGQAGLAISSANAIPIPMLSLSNGKFSVVNTLLLSKQGQWMGATLSNNVKTQAPSQDGSSLRTTSADYHSADGHNEKISISIGADGVLIIELPAKMETNFDDRHVALLSIAVAKQNLGIKGDDIQGILIKNTGAPI
ncbi:beta strand repeat-containing protein, partial [Methylobacter psychrophilus]|uniref:beta strand repeat-containing protein n=1 Tax=Methylobacter psychrophilus TaxID=96941 RepID=UPI0021D50A04